MGFNYSYNVHKIWGKKLYFIDGFLSNVFLKNEVTSENISVIIFKISIITYSALIFFEFWTFWGTVNLSLKRQK